MAVALPIWTSYTSHIDTSREAMRPALDQRGSASQHEMQLLYQRRKMLQEDAESESKVAELQPPVCSLEGLFAAAELGNVEALKAMLHGFPLPKYDPDTGTYRPNSDRTTLPQQKVSVSTITAIHVCYKWDDSSYPLKLSTGSQL
jgi:hypothetical protein